LYAQTNIAEWRTELQQAQHDTTRLLCYAKLAFLYSDTNIDSAALFLQKGKKMAEQYPKHPAVLPFWSAYGSYYATLRDQKNANFYYQKTKDLAFDMNNDKYKKIASFNLINSKYLDVGNYAGAIKALFEFKALLDTDKHSPKKYYQVCYANLSMCYSSLTDVKNGEKYALKILDYSVNKEDSLEYYKRMADAIHNDPKQYNKLTKIYRKGVLLSIETQNKVQEISFTNNMAMACLNTQRYKKALFYVKKTEQMALKNNFASSVMYAKRIYGQIFLGLKQYPKAISYLEEAIPFYRKAAINDELLVSLAAITKAYEMLGNYKMAYRYKVEASDLQENILGKEKQQIAGELNSQYELSDKEKQIIAKDLLIKLKEQETTAEQRAKNITIIWLIVTVLSLLWASLNYYKQNKLRQKVTLQAQELTRINQSKNKLFAMLGHDLRTPVSHLVSAMSASSNTKASDETKQIKTELENVQLVLNNLLHWAGIQIKDIKPILQTTPLKEVVETVINQLETTAYKKNITMLDQSHDVTVMVDESQLQIVIRNVLSNAIKFSYPGSYIRITTEKHGNIVKLTIRDTGMGMTESQLKCVFEIPAPQQGTAGEKGTGIGLNICKELIEKNGGSIRIESKQHKGTALCIELFS
jgi:signal transduction histidine kinase